MTPHVEVLTETQRRVLADLCSRLKRTRFYLAGETAAALHLGHRWSVDLDWFTPGPQRNPMDFAARLKSRGIALEIVSIDRETLYGHIHGMQVSFIAYRYPLLAPPIHSLGCKLASLGDIACMKLSTIADRGARRDFVDLYTVMKAHKTLSSLIRLYQKTYGIHDVGHLLRALSYFDDAKKKMMPVMLWDVQWKVIRRELESQLLHVVKSARRR